MKHKHADLIIEAANDTFIVWEWRRGNAHEWYLKEPDNIFYPYLEYRKKPKTIDMWLWVYKNSDGIVKLTLRYFTKETDVIAAYGNPIVIQKIESSKITIMLD